MPRFSIVVLAYKVAQYLPGCLESIKDQSFEDWEAIVVVDASPDNCAEIAQGFAAADSRFKVIAKEKNEGTHLARRSGTLAATGEWIMYVDGDDGLMPGALQSISEALDEGQPCDLLRFGVVVEQCGASEEMCESYSAHANRSLASCSGREALYLAYAENGRYMQDWRAWANVFRVEVAKKAFGAMTRGRLDRAEDSYEFFVLLTFVMRQVMRTDILGYRYEYGRGVTGSGVLSVERFKKDANDFKLSMQAIDEFASSSNDRLLIECAAGACAKLMEIVFSDWDARVLDSEKIEAARSVVNVFGADAVASELERLVRDKAYAYVIREEVAPADAPLFAWHDLALELVKDRETSQRFKSFSRAARNHVTDLAQLRMLQSGANESIRIFVPFPQHFGRFDSVIMQPIQVGCASAAARLHTALRDDTGDNISQKFDQYNALTAQYWAWKNIDAEYYGFFKHDRYLNFSDRPVEELFLGEAVIKEMDAEAQQRCGLDDASIRAAVEGWDVIASCVQDLHADSGKLITPFERWTTKVRLPEQCLLDMLALVEVRHPDYASDIQAYVHGHCSRLHGLYVMRKPVFSDYCGWLFALLDKYAAMHETAVLAHDGQPCVLRCLSHELLNIYLIHQERTVAGFKVKGAQPVRFGSRISDEQPQSNGILETVCDAAAFGRCVASKLKRKILG